MNGLGDVVVVAITDPTKMIAVRSKSSLNGGGIMHEHPLADPTIVQSSTHERNILDVVMQMCRRAENE
jgi:hypothetical protein